MKLDQLCQVRADARVANNQNGFLLEARRLWSEARPLAGTIGEFDMSGVGYAAGPLPITLRFRPAGRVRHPQIVAAVKARTNELLAVEITILDRVRSVLADLPKVKIVIGEPGGAVRLALLAQGLKVVATIEEALALCDAGTPAWAALNADRIAHVIVPETERVAA